MARQPKLYTRLPGRGTAGFQHSRLWLGSDHLLLVSSSTIGERYKRFYFADIQAILLRKTAHLMIWSIVWALLAASFGLLAIASEEVPARATFATFAAIFGIAFLLHLTRGPTSQCHVRTAVQTEELPSLRRLRTARKVLAQLRPRIEAAQMPASPIAGEPA